ncbi:hypothetical protein O7632_10740 [Solwaraspora sp. WMMD406]|uniref:hypothetical protein n=1 Tax=Solwaraspora sp. WMMD406 TaxID=3016095 RepID=UPI0024162DC7|nr:hypothetical protein [Solwaraspora sp. WMMD406]MDG4764575.1 hypothetical protein [Solwaraspora sp. WMMD406]
MRADVDVSGLHGADRADLAGRTPVTGKGAGSAVGSPPVGGEPPLTAPGDVLHVPVRPIWSCSGCGPLVDWPCAYARAELTVNLDPISRSMYAAEWMVEAIADLPAESSPGEMFTRFLAWTRRSGR